MFRCKSEEVSTFEMVCTPLAGQKRQKRRAPQGVCIIPRFGAADFSQKKAHVSRIVYSCKTALKSGAFRPIFAGIAKDPPQSVSLFIPTNVGIHGAGNRT